MGNGDLLMSHIVPEQRRGGTSRGVRDVPRLGVYASRTNQLFTGAFHF